MEDRRVGNGVSTMLAYWDADERCRFATVAYERSFGVAPDWIVGRHMRDLLGTSYDLDAPYIDAVLRGESQEVERSTVDSSRGTERRCRTTYVADTVGDTVRGFFVIRRDVSADSELLRIEAEQSVLADAGIAFQASLDYKQTLQQVAKLILRHGFGELCIIDMLDPDGSVERVTVIHTDPGMADSCARLAAMPLDREHLLAAPALATRTPHLIDITDELTTSLARDADHLAVLRGLALRSAIMLPLVTPTRLLGALVIASRESGRYMERDLVITSEVAHRAACAIENAQRYENARRASDARDEVLGIVAHDVRSPLDGIRLALELVARRPSVALDPIALAALQTATASIAHAHRLMADLLDVRRIEAGVLAVDGTVMPIESIIDEAVRSNQLAATAASHELVRVVAAVIPAVRIDHDRILQVLENLIGNAIKFSAAGGRIRVEAVAELDNVVVSVRDTGPGIATEDLARVFDRFWRSGGARRDSAGLGLSICKGIIEAHGGRIWAESEPGAGSSFRFSIPIAERSTTAPAAAT